MASINDINLEISNIVNDHEKFVLAPSGFISAVLFDNDGITPLVFDNAELKFTDDRATAVLRSNRLMGQHTFEVTGLSVGASEVSLLIDGVDSGIAPVTLTVVDEPRTLEDDVSDGLFDVEKSTMTMEKSEISLGEKVKVHLDIYSRNFPDTKLSGLRSIELMDFMGDSFIIDYKNFTEDNGRYTFEIEPSHIGQHEISAVVSGILIPAQPLLVKDPRTIEDDIRDGFFDPKKSVIRLNPKDVIVGKSLEVTVELFSRTHPDERMSGVTDVVLTSNNANSKVEFVSETGGVYKFKVTGEKVGNSDLKFSVKGVEGTSTERLTVKPVPRTLEDDIREGTFDPRRSVIAVPAEGVIVGNDTEVTVTLYSLNFEGQLLSGVSDVVLVPANSATKAELISESEGVYRFKVTGVREGDSNLSFTVKGKEGTDKKTLTVHPVPRTLEDDVKEGKFDKEDSYLTFNADEVMVGKSIPVSVILFSENFEGEILAGVKDVKLVTDDKVTAVFDKEIDGEYIFNVTGAKEGSTTLKFSVMGVASTSGQTLKIVPIPRTVEDDIRDGLFDLDKSTIEVSKSSIYSDESVVVTVKLHSASVAGQMLPDVESLELLPTPKGLTVELTSQAKGEYKYKVTGEVGTFTVGFKTKAGSSSQKANLKIEKRPKTMNDLDTTLTELEIDTNEFDIAFPKKVTVSVIAVADDGTILIPTEGEFRVSSSIDDQYFKDITSKVDAAGVTTLTFELTDNTPIGEMQVYVVSKTLDAIIGQGLPINVKKTPPKIEDISPEKTISSISRSEFDHNSNTDPITIMVEPVDAKGDAVPFVVDDFIPSTENVTIEILSKHNNDGVFEITFVPEPDEIGSLVISIVASKTGKQVSDLFTVNVTDTLPLTPLTPSKTPVAATPDIPLPDPLDPPKETSNNDWLSGLVGMKTTYRNNPAGETVLEMFNQKNPEGPTEQ